MKNIWTITLGAVALIGVAGASQAYTHHPSTPVERAQTKALNDEQLQLAKEVNTGLAINASATAKDTSAPPTPVQRINADGTGAPASSAGP